MPTCTNQACRNAEPPCHDDTCEYAYDGECDDGSLSHGSGACDAGTDATDCDTAATTTTAHDDDGDWDSKNHCRASNNDRATNNPLGACCWRGPDEPFACDSGYRPELDGGDCSWWSGGSGKAMSCKQDSSYTTVPRCEEHVAGFCQEQSAGAIAFCFIYMVWELIV